MLELVRVGLLGRLGVCGKGALEKCWIGGTNVYVNRRSR